MIKMFLSKKMMESSNLPNSRRNKRSLKFLVTANINNKKVLLVHWYITLVHPTTPVPFLVLEGTMAKMVTSQIILSTSFKRNVNPSNYNSLFDNGWKISNEVYTTKFNTYVQAFP